MTDASDDTLQPDDIQPLDPHRADGALGEKVAAALESASDEIGARLIRTFQAWLTLKDHATKERKRLSEELSARIALFTEAMQVGHSTPSDQVLKLSVVEARWQDLEDARDARKQVSSALRDQIKLVEQKIKDQIAEARSGQLALFQTSSEDSTTSPE